MQSHLIGLIQDQALTNERLGVYWLSQRDEKDVQLYREWGAMLKVQRLEKEMERYGVSDR